MARASRASHPAGRGRVLARRRSRWCRRSRRLIGEPYYVTLFTRIVIFALAAVGLNLILGYGGLVSFGHAMYIGIGAYAVGILSFHGIGNGWVQLARGARRRRAWSRSSSASCACAPAAWPSS